MKNTRTQRSRTLLFELNEFNRKLLLDASKELKYQNIQKILSLNESQIKTKDTYESDFLEPWVQWVNIHTGKESSEHKVKHLGDIPDLSFPQLWEVLSDKDKNIGVWGVLNGGLGKAKENCKFFFPDPWTFSESAHPKKLNSFLNLPRYMAKNRMHLKLGTLLKYGFQLLWGLCTSGALKEGIVEAPRALRMIFKYPKSEFSGFCFAEYLLGVVFLHLWKKHKIDFGILFVNSLAHLQHYYWNDFNYKENEKLSYGLYYIDKLLGKVLADLDLKKDKIVICNGLSQMNTNHEKPWISYRPIDHNSFLKQAGLNPKSVEPLMSYDALIFFETKEECEQALKVLTEAKVGELPLFLVENYSHDPKKLFYRLQFYDPVDEHTTITINNTKLRFKDHLKKIIQRTGRHIPTSSLYTNDENVPAKMMNHEIFNYMTNLVTGSNHENRST